MGKKLLTEKEAATYINMSQSFLSHKRVEGFLKSKPQGPAFMRFGRAIRYNKDDLDSWVNENKVGSHQ